MPTYADLAPAVRAVVDRKAREGVARNGGDLRATAEHIAARVETKTYSYGNGKAH